MHCTAVHTSFQLHPRMRGARRRLMAMLAIVVCVLSLGLAWAVADTASSAAAEHQRVHESVGKAAGCGAAELSCQEVAERECSLPEAGLGVAERLVLPPDSRSHPLAQMTLAPPERPPRLQA